MLRGMGIPLIENKKFPCVLVSWLLVFVFSWLVGWLVGWLVSWFRNRKVSKFQRFKVSKVKNGIQHLLEDIDFIIPNCHGVFSGRFLISY